jgi:hypothetical protein
MEDKDHINGVGNIVLNLQALESLLRGSSRDDLGAAHATILSEPRMRSIAPA